MKTVFPTDEIPHLWAHQTQAEARNGGRNNLYFEGATIFSYGSHFPIARHVTNKRGAKAILFTTKDYSVTTRVHIYAVRGAIPPGAMVFHVPCVDWPSYRDTDSHKDNLSYFPKRITELLEQAAEARKNQAEFIADAHKVRLEAEGYCKFYSLKKLKLPHIPELDSEELKNLAAELEAAKAKETARKIKESKDSIRAWRNGSSSVALPYGIPTMLRIHQALDAEGMLYVQTSKGATFPLRHAALALKIVKRCRETKEPWHTNGHTIHLGHYTLDSIDADGTVHAGCHVVTFDEIERIAPQIEELAADLKAE